MLDYFIFATTFFVVLIISVIYLYPGSKKQTTVPGPEPVDPLEGNFPDIRACGSFHEFLVELHENYGVVASFWAGPQLCVSVACYKLFEEFQGYFERPELLCKAPALLWGENCLYVTNGVQARKKRSSLTNLFNESFSRNFLHQNQNIIEIYTNKWSQFKPEEHFPLFQNLSNLLFHLFTSSFLDLHDEKALHIIQTSLDQLLVEVDQLMMDSQDVTGDRNNKIDLYKKNVKDQIKKSIEKFLNKNNEEKKNNIILSEILSQNEDFEKGEPLKIINNQEIIDFIFLIFSNFYYKTSFLFSWIFYFLASEKKIQTKLRKELEKVESFEIKYEELQNLEYLNAVFKESLRLGKIMPFCARVHNLETIVEGHKIPAGTPIVQALGVIWQNEDLFPDPDCFNPERFLKNPPPLLSFTPFGFSGSRKCPASSSSSSSFFLQALGAIVLASFLKNFSMELIPNQDLQRHFGLFTKPKEEIWLSLRQI